MTGQEFLNLIDDDHRDRINKYINKTFKERIDYFKVDKMSFMDFAYGCFVWESTPEGNDYWRDYFFKINNELETIKT
jgi:hypothetical protein